MSLKFNNPGISNGHKALAASDGELNVMEGDVPVGSSNCSSSNSSLPSAPSERPSGVDQTASWAVSFERLLEDPTGVHYFTAFLKSEVSAENILFWKACEKFRRIPASNQDELYRQAFSIYNVYLSDNATLPVNIDDTARVAAQTLSTPHPDMFQKAQQQIFKLMKFDSYTRFVRSQLYQSCMLANVEGRPLPEIGPRSKAPAAKKAALGEGPFLRDQQRLDPKQKERTKNKSGDEERRRQGQGQRWDRRQEKAGSWGDPLAPGKSGVYTRTELEQFGPRSLDSDLTGALRADKYCCVYLPDGTASLMPARPGLSVREMLAGLCEKRGLPLKDITIYLQGKDKKPLSLDQDSAVLKDHQIVLELRVTLAVRIVFMGKTVTIVAKSNKTLQEALSTILQKYNMRPHEAFVTLNSSGEVLNMNMKVASLANKTIILDKAKGDVPNSAVKLPVAGPGLQMRRGGITEHDMSSSGSAPQGRGNARQRNPGLRRTYDMDGLAELLNRAQWCSADDQRGLLSKEHLVLPQFLQQQTLPEEEAGASAEEEDQDQGGDQGPSQEQEQEQGYRLTDHQGQSTASSFGCPAVEAAEAGPNSGPASGFDLPPEDSMGSLPPGGVVENSNQSADPSRETVV
ncbi:regulator of G-protein signaling 14 isoform X2 [Engraulis encrasicolus]|uniref:regulator of G-protein signaling 14 isoform X2 n=1 Tax=Engraulis encrasicolus TaxID=184585 RepID=UPI002FD0FC5C